MCKTIDSTIAFNQPMIYVTTMCRSLEMFDSHVKGYHSVSLHEFAAYIGKTNVHYRCQFCMQEQ